MKTEIGQFEIFSHYNDTQLFLDEIRKASDANRDSLGFIRKSVFEEFARNNNIYVLAEKCRDGSRYAGHLLFRRFFPRASIVQMFTLEKYRRRGLATMLLNQLITSLTHDGFLSIYARVAEDLTDANVFWEQQCFYVQRIEKGGDSRKRQIIVRCHELSSPQLFPTSGINANNPLGLSMSPANVVPLFLLDLNVLFDVAPRRLRHNEARSLFQADRMNFCSLAISTEVREELRRTALQGKTDPMEAYISLFPSFPLSLGNDTLVKELASLIFPAKSREMKLTANDISDLRHVATAIQHNLAGFITNDTKILNSAPHIKAKYDVEIVSPESFELDGVVPQNCEFEASADFILKLLEVSDRDEASIHALLSKLNLSGSTIAAGWVPNEPQSRIAIRYAIWCELDLIAYFTWSPRDTTGSMIVRVAVDETHSQALAATRILFIFLLERLISYSPRQIRLEFPCHQSYVREVAFGFGFRGSQSQNCLTKFIMGRVLTKKSWSACQSELAGKGGIRLPTAIPSYRKFDQHIPIFTPDGNQRYITLDELESLLSPALLCLPCRPAVITPIQRRFSEPLLGHSQQTSLLPFNSVSLFQERHYISDSSTLKYFKKGALILFYESTKQNGRGAIIAIARVRQAYLKPCDDLGNHDLERSVLNEINLTNIGKANMKTITVFDNTFPLTHPVPLKSLQRIGCGRPNDLITTRTISDDKLQAILNEAFDHG